MLEIYTSRRPRCTLAIVQYIYYFIICIMYRALVIQKKVRVSEENILRFIRHILHMLYSL